MEALSFKDFKAQFIIDCKRESACEPEFKKVLASTNWNELMLVIKANIEWCVIHKVITLDILAKVPDKELVAVDIYLNKMNLELTSKKVELFNSTATLRENSTATLWENSTATLRENSTATLWGNSTATLRGNSYIDIYQYGKAVSINDNSICRERSTGKIYLSNNKLEIIYV